MVDIFLFLVGGLLVALVFYDFLRTTISMSGSGPITAAITYGIWRLARRTVPRAEHVLGPGIRHLIGPGILSMIAASWITLHLLGYTMMFAAQVALVSPDTGEPAGLVEKVAFVGASLSTLGASVVEPANGWWDVLSMIAAINGMIVLTLAVSFVLNILQITASARSFALRLHAVTEGLDPGDTRERLERAAGLGSDLCEVATQITASPLPGVFVPRDPVLNFPAAVAQLGNLLERAAHEPPGTTTDALAAELRWSLIMLGRHASRDHAAPFDGALRWAEMHSLPNAARASG